jgi:hypothetical protein
MKQAAWASATLAIIWLASACATTTPSASRADTHELEPVATSTGDESLQLDANTTTPSQLRTRLAYPLERPSLARIQRPIVSSWVFVIRSGDVSPEESRPALMPGAGEPFPYRGSVTSDPVGRELITTMAEADADGARLRYAR